MAFNLKEIYVYMHLCIPLLAEYQILDNYPHKLTCTRFRRMTAEFEPAD